MFFYKKDANFLLNWINLDAIDNENLIGEWIKDEKTSMKGENLLSFLR